MLCTCNPVIEYPCFKGKVIIYGVLHLSFELLISFRNTQIDLAMKLMHNH